MDFDDLNLMFEPCDLFVIHFHNATHRLICSYLPSDP